MITPYIMVTYTGITGLQEIICMNQETFEIIKKNWGKCSSWLIWDEDDASGMNWASSPDLHKKLKTDYVFVALNFSESKNATKGMVWGNFHSRDVNIKKLISAFKGTKFEACYITDVIKNFEDSSSESVSENLKKNPCFEKSQVQNFKEELSCFGKPVLLALGNEVFDILTRNHIDDDFKVVKIEHYASRSNASDYREKVRRQLQEAGEWE